ncbi:MAG: DUF115 domain-containing protein, partial [Desulfobulbaceae bacterium]|nr:DUF115 domain-containing protein [Desulfobulbaceae bacterium]
MSEEAGRAVLAANMKIVHERWPEIGRVLLEAPRPAEFTVTTQQPYPTLFVDGIHLSSGYDPVREAELQAGLIPSCSRSAWVYGFGGGHLPRVLLKRAALAGLTVVIMNHGVAALSLACFDHADWLADPRVKLVLAEAEQEIKVPFAAVPSCLQLASDAAARLRDLVFLELATPFAEKRLQEKKDSWRPRLRENISFVIKDGDVASLFGSRPGERIIVAAAGPTLSTHYQWLQSLGGQHCLIAVDAALKPLLVGGICPDMVVSIDGLPVVAKFFEDIEHPSMRRSILVYAPVLYPEILERWPGRRLASYPSDPMYAAMAQEYPRGSLFASGSVLHPAVDLAVKMG